MFLIAVLVLDRALFLCCSGASSGASMHVGVSSRNEYRCYWRASMWCLSNDCSCCNPAQLCTQWCWYTRALLPLVVTYAPAGLCHWQGL